MDIDCRTWGQKVAEKLHSNWAPLAIGLGLPLVGLLINLAWMLSVEWRMP